MSELETIKTLVQDAVKETVSGKIDRLSQRMEDHIIKSEEYVTTITNHMADVAPIIKEYQDRLVRDAFIKDTGEKVKWGAGIIIAVGVVWAFLKSIFKV